MGNARQKYTDEEWEGLMQGFNMAKHRTELPKVLYRVKITNKKEYKYVYDLMEEFKVDHSGIPYHYAYPFHYHINMTDVHIFGFEPKTYGLVGYKYKVNINEKRYFNEVSIPFMEAMLVKWSLYHLKKELEKEPQVATREELTSVTDESWPLSYIDVETKSRIELENIKTDGRLQRLQGQKFSQEKPPVFTFCKQFDKAITELSLRSLYGHERYKETDGDWKNFERVDNPDFEYSNAMFRHALGIEGEETEKEHFVAAAWNAIARLQIYLKENQK